MSESFRVRGRIAPCERMVLRCGSLLRLMARVAIVPRMPVAPVCADARVSIPMRPAEKILLHQDRTVPGGGAVLIAQDNRPEVFVHPGTRAGSR